MVPLPNRTDPAPARWRRPFELWFDAADRGWPLAVFLGLFLVVWSLVLIVAYHGLGLNPDVVEIYALSKDLAWGYAKHPPLPSWIMAAWMAVFPFADWPPYLLAILNAALGLYFVDRIARRYLRGDRRLLLLLLLVFVPGYHFLAAVFNHNIVLLWLWPLATWCFLRSFETRRASWAVAAGATAALALLGKYYSAILLVSFAITALVHRDRRAYLRSPAPWVSAIVGAVVLMPNIVWLLKAGAIPLNYAIEAHVVPSRWTSLRFAGEFVAGALGYAVLPVAIWLAATATATSPRRALALIFSGMSAERQLLLILGIMTLSLPPIVAVLIGTNMPPLWALPGVFLPVLFIVSAPGFTLTRARAVNVAALTVVFALVAILGSPFHAWLESQRRDDRHRIYARPAAGELERLWRKVTDRPMLTVTGEYELAWAASYYVTWHPDFVASYDARRGGGNPIPATIPSAGWAGLCAAESLGCIAWTTQLAATVPRARREEFTVTPAGWGWTATPGRMIAVIVPPSGAAD
ncbi:MAG: glycosyltransferase family 39 protein [Xanthobacteraceae bacterium]|nr:MAG: glycosyltransferase family 39 protein [Xanthobacteraceae bacterium]